MSDWKPMLATNCKIDKLVLPIYSSVKLEGVRGEFTPDGLFTRPLKRFNNMLLGYKFIKVTQHCRQHGLILEGEFYKHGMVFSDISSICRRAEHAGVEDLEFHVFDVYIESMPTASFETRIKVYEQAVRDIGMPEVIAVEQYLQETKDEVISFYDDCIEGNYEGWCGKHPRSAYKKGRSTVNEGHYLRLKPEDTFDGVVIEIVERLENLCESEVNELGLMSKKQDKDQKASTGLAAVAIVKSKGFNKPIRVSLSRGILDYQDTKKSPSRASIFANRASFIGRNIRFVGFTIKGMDLPRSPRFDDWRTDLDE